ncbi:TIGR03668 family PPOX class F420-dependent oxidoreductase [Antrihabitans cavernicola]|uniref:TIGR03668 family PPOX class F420-dependent oxidoreductase n=1 Tax=Antrihabitans cavernicola TaxID=2495913 RepID=A0A5A7SF12_9NOCA|nr:TIGR03668 family PPOX class F420-dependent oxidoreductase [Spelaeibacter cavernicola]KAA0024174.1 TIGR03668 family PPOX class F420-dependent oxidoreductase [Spelaeibacter cavernicola]
MTSDEVRERFASSPVARLATVGADGRPHLVPVVFALVDDTVCMAVDHKPKTTRALRRLDNIAATGHVSLLVDHYEGDWSQLWWLRVDGNAQVVDADSPDGVTAIDALVAKYPQYDDARPEGPAIVVRDLQWHHWLSR